MEAYILNQPIQEGTAHDIICKVTNVNPAGDVRVVFINGTQTTTAIVTTSGNSATARRRVTLTRYDNGRQDLRCKVTWRTHTVQKSITTPPRVLCE